MEVFKGFPEGKHHQVSIPSLLFKDLLPIVDDLGEMKISLYTFWRLDQMEGAFRFLRFSDLANDPVLLTGLRKPGISDNESLHEALNRAVQRGTLLEFKFVPPEDVETVYFLNSPRGRAALQALKSGKWHPDLSAAEPPQEIGEPPNIFRLYEENIGALSPMIAESLKDAEENYPLLWIEEAIRIAVENNKRNWRYIMAILERWGREGKHGKKEKPEDRSDTEDSRRRYVEGEFSEFVEH